MASAKAPAKRKSGAKAKPKRKPSETGRITRKWLQEVKACEPGLEWFDGRFPRGGTIEKVIDALVADDKSDWILWLLSVAVTRKDYEKFVRCAYILGESESSTVFTHHGEYHSLSDYSGSVVPAVLYEADAVTAGDSSMAISLSGDAVAVNAFSTAVTQGNDCIAVTTDAGSYSYSKGKDCVAACLGLDGTVMAGPGGTLVVGYEDEDGWYKVAVGYVGKDDIKEYVPYKVDGQGNFYEARND